MRCKDDFLVFGNVWERASSEALNDGLQDGDLQRSLDNLDGIWMVALAISKIING